MSQGIDILKIIYAAIIYGIFSILIGYFILDLAPYAAIMAALGAGIYAGHKAKPIGGITNGLLGGLIGGIITGIVSINVNNIAGIPMSISITNFLTPIFTNISPSDILLPTTALTIIGIFFGAVGGLLGSIRKLRGIFLFVLLFLLFITFGAVDNAAWNILTPDWTWNMSFSHVLTNPIDLFVAVVFAFVVTVVAYVMNLFK